MQTHSAYRLTYAIDQTGQLVNVDNVPVGNKCGCFCPACKEPLIAKNQGTKRKHHFAHQSGTECDYAVESMLHILAKDKIREAFLSKSEFWIEFEYKSYCVNDKECKFIRYSKCCERKTQRFDIKQYYDSCEQEIPYDNINRRSDLKIFSSTHPKRDPIYLEFCVTHASDREKLHSGNKIIEIRIESVDDVLQLVENGIIESKINDEEYEFLDENEDLEYLQDIRFYGFKKKDNINNHISNDIEFYRYILHQSGKIHFSHDFSDCKRFVKSKASSLLEICVHSDDTFDFYKKFVYIGFQKYHIPNCLLCRNYVDSYSGIGKICRLYKYLQIPRYEDFDTARAKTCNCFEINQEEMQSVLQEGLNEYHTTTFEK